MKTTRIRMLKPALVNGRHYEPGDLVDCPHGRLLKQLLTNGTATPADLDPDRSDAVAVVAAAIADATTKDATKLLEAMTQRPAAESGIGPAEAPAGPSVADVLAKVKANAKPAPTPKPKA